MLIAIETAAKVKGSMPTRDDVIAALRDLHFQGIAYARPVTWDAKGDNTAAVILLTTVEGDHFKEIGEVSRDDLTRQRQSDSLVSPSPRSRRIARCGLGGPTLGECPFPALRPTQQEGRHGTEKPADR